MDEEVELWDFWNVFNKINDTLKMFLMVTSESKIFVMNTTCVCAAIEVFLW